LDPATAGDKAEIIVQPSSTAKHSLLAFLSITTASAFAFLFGLGGLGLIGPDEPRYAEVAREMFANGDLISTRLSGCLWFEKPVLQYWLSAMSYGLFGVTEFAARLPIAMSALFTVALLHVVIHRCGFPKLAATASLVLGTSGLFIAYAHVVAQDMILTASVTASLLAFFLWSLSSGRKRTLCWLLVFAFAALSVLAKGLVGIVLVFGIAGIHLLVTRNWRSIRWMEVLAGLIAFIVLAGSWYVPVTIRHGWAFFEEFFIRHHFQRYTTNEFGHPQPIYFFLLVGIAGVAPWTFFLIPAFSRLKSLKPSLSARDSLIALAWIWTALPLLFFSFSESKLPGYILPIIPALAIIIGAEIERLWNLNRRRLLMSAVWMTCFMVLVIGVGVILFAHRERTLNVEQTVLCALPAVAALATIVFVIAGRCRLFIVGTAGVVLSTILVVVVLLFPVLSNEVSLKPLSLEAASALRPGEKIAFYLKKDFAAVFYSEGRVLCEAKRGNTFYALHQDMLAEALQTESSFVVITDAHWVPGLKGDNRFTTEDIATQGDAVALRVSLNK